MLASSRRFSGGIISRSAECHNMAMRKTSQGVRPFGRYNFSGKASLLHCPSVVSAVDLDPDGSASRVVLEPFIVVALDPREGAICTVVHIAVQCVLSLRLKSQSGG